MQVQAYLSDAEYRALRLADMRGQLCAAITFERDAKSGVVTFEIDRHGPRLFCEQIERVIDFGATRAADVFFDGTLRRVA